MRLDKEIARHYYTAAQAREVLGLSEQEFQYWVRKGRVRKVLLPGKAQGVYNRREVDDLASRIEAAIIADQTDTLEFKKATIDDLEAEYELSYLIFGKGAHTVEIRRAYLEHNPDTIYHLYDDGKLAAFIDIVPYTKEATEQFITGQKRGKELDPNDIEPFIPGKPQECIIMEMATTPTVPPGRRTLYGTQLLINMAKVFREWGERGIILTKIYATSSTPTGIRILNSAGFKPIRSLGQDRSNPGSQRYAFELDISESNAKLLKGYKSAIEEWKKEQENKAKNRRSRKPVIPSV
jgi:hypothetical protein